MLTPTPFTWGESEFTKPAINVIWAVVEGLIAAYSAYTATKLADQQMDIARRYYDIAKGWWDWYRSAYVPLEDAEVAEAMALPIHTPKYDIAVGRAKATARYIFRNRMDQSVQCTSQYATGIRGARLLDEAKRQSYTMAAVENMGYRNERNRIDILNSRRWARREAVANRGRDLMANNVSYGQVAGAILGDLAAQAGKAAGGALYAMGYTLNRNETHYPKYMYYDGVQRRNNDFVGPPQPTWVQPDSQIGWNDPQRVSPPQQAQQPHVPSDSQVGWNDTRITPTWVQPDSQLDRSTTRSGLTEDDFIADPLG